MGSICSTISSYIADPSEGQFMWQQKNVKKIRYNTKSKMYRRRMMYKDDFIKEETLKDLQNC